MVKAEGTSGTGLFHEQKKKQCGLSVRNRGKVR
jgi:hypothetical protein